MNQPLVTVVIATFNSAKFLDRVLKAIRNQTIEESLIEILIVDGGSSDSTFDLASQYGCRLIHNTHTEPVHAKYLGLVEARGKYLAYVDHDEVLLNKDSFQKRISLIESRVGTFAAIVSGYLSPPESAEINNYINDFGDPFSYFIYRLPKSNFFFESTLRKKYVVQAEYDGGIWFDFSSNAPPLIELCAAATLIITQEARKLIDGQLAMLPHAFYIGLRNSQYVVFSKNDPVMHYSVEMTTQYLRKIAWRVKNNIYHQDMGKSGFSGRNFLVGASMKKYLYIPYVFTFALLICDTIYLVVTRRKLIYLLHVPLSVYTATLILYHFFKKTLGFREKLRSYDEKKIIT